MEIREARHHAECRQAANLHRQNIPSGFLSSLGINLLTRMYAFIADDKYSTLIVAIDHDKVVGFISGTVNVSSFYRRFILKNILWGVILLPKLVAWKRLKTTVETLFYPRKEELINLPQAELLSIVVDRPYQGKGISALLYEGLKIFFQAKGVPAFKIIVGGTLSSAVRFYQKMGAHKITEIEVHAGCTSWVMLQQIR